MWIRVLIVSVMSAGPDGPPAMGCPLWLLSTTLPCPAPLRSTRIFLAFFDCAPSAPAALAPKRKGGCARRILSGAVRSPPLSRFFALLIILTLSNVLPHTTSQVQM